MSQANYIVQKPAVFDLPRNDMVLSDGVTALGFAESGMALRSTVSSEDTNYEIFSIQDDPVEPFVRLQCNRKQ